MQSLSTKLLQAAIWAKLQTWLKYINGEKGDKFDLENSENCITIQQDILFSDHRGVQCATKVDPSKVSCTFPVITIRFGTELGVATTNKRATIPYSDPDLYRKLFAVIDYGAKHGFSDAVDVIMRACKGNLSTDDWS